MPDSDTIFAVASGAGQAAVAVMRVSGPATGRLLAAMMGTCPPPRRASLRTLRDGTGAALDRALVLWLPGPQSYTGEDCAELHLHGGIAVIEGVADHLLALGARTAEPGEFTRRAFLNDRMDLLQAEAIADLISAETAAQRRQAIAQLNGGLGGIYQGWADRLLRLLAQQEALIDFPDEALPPETERAMLADIATLRAEMACHLDDDRRGERLREGLVFAIVGAPNVGKSTLINALAGRDAAIVTPHPGTTRDVLEVRTVFGGVPVTLLDTAGLCETDDEIEAEGVRRARVRAAAADLRIEVDDGRGGAGLGHECGRCIQVASKADLRGACGDGECAVSAVTGKGMEQLRQTLGCIARDLTAAAGAPALTRARHRAALTDAVTALARALNATDMPELRGEDLRQALADLGRITGRITTEDLLGSIFSQFCIGK